MERLSDAELFVAIVDAGGFSGAARRLGRSQPALSRRVGALEARLGTRLLARTTRRVRTTEAGAVFYERCKEVVAALRAAEDSVADASGAVRGRLRVSAPPTFARARLAPLLGELLRVHPELSVELVLVERYVDLVEEGFDVAIRLGPLRDSSLAGRVIARGRYVLCAAPAYLERAGRPRAVAELARRDALVLTTSPSRRTWPFRQGGRLRRVEVAGNVASNDAGLLHQAARAGVGIAALPSYLVAEDLASGALVEILPRARLPRFELHALYPSRRHLPARVRAFVDFLVDRLGAGAARVAGAERGTARRSSRGAIIPR